MDKEGNDQLLKGILVLMANPLELDLLLSVVERSLELVDEEEEE